MKIYLAGKVSKNGWRTGLVTPVCLFGVQDLCGIDADSLPDPTNWPVLRGAIFGQHDYVGPFVIGCNHGCFHGDGTHGLGVGGLPTCDQDGGSPFTRADVVRMCLAAVTYAELVFCWIEADEDYGSMVEIGYALALGRHVAVYGASEEVIERHWFAGVAASSCGVTASPEEGLREALSRIEAATEPQRSSSPSIPVIAWNRCGSPIETALLSGFATLATRRGVCIELDVDGQRLSLTPPAPLKMLLYLQRKVCGHRADFVAEVGAIRAVVECDGHQYHNATKQQVQHDRELDRLLQREGFKVLRFTGSEIYRDAEVCAATVLEHMGIGGGA